jgi:hypothetical protein
MRNPRVVAWLAVVALFPAPQAQAQAPWRPHLEITPTVGWRTGGELETSVSNLFDTDAEIDDSAIYGVTIDIPISHEFQVELLFNRQDSFFRADHGLFDQNTRLADVTVDNYQAGLLWQWGGGQVNPFVVLTLGMARLDPDVAGASSEDRFASSFGGGAKIFFNRNLGVRIEGRGYWADLGGGNFDDCAYYDDYCYGYNYDDDLYQFEGSVGLILSF